MGVYEGLKAEKASGVVLSLKDLSPSHLRSMFITEHIPDSMIAELYEVPESRVTHLRRKYGITILQSVLDDCLLGKTEKTRKMNEEAMGQVLAKPNISRISKAITHFAFRNGPIEDMHANDQLSESDMKTLNKFMVDRLAYVFTLIVEERWLEFAYLIAITDQMFGAHWDEAKADDGDTRRLIELMVKARHKRH